MKVGDQVMLKEFYSSRFHSISGKTLKITDRDDLEVLDLITRPGEDYRVLVGYFNVCEKVMETFEIFMAWLRPSEKVVKFEEAIGSLQLSDPFKCGDIYFGPKTNCGPYLGFLPRWSIDRTGFFYDRETRCGFLLPKCNEQMMKLFSIINNS